VAVVSYQDASSAAGGDVHRDIACPGIEGVFNQFLDDGGRSLDDLTGGDLVGEYFG